MPSVPQQRRFKDALEQIAAGAENPAAIAKEAIRSRKLPPKPWHQSKGTRVDRVARAISFFRNWVDAGKPSHRKFGDMNGISGSRVGQILGQARRGLREESRCVDPRTDPPHLPRP